MVYDWKIRKKTFSHRARCDDTQSPINAVYRVCLREPRESAQLLFQEARNSSEPPFSADRVFSFDITNNIK
jgi:hypothetical protein